MMNSMKKIVVGISLFAFVQSSFSMIVFDPTNWVQNNASAIAAVKNEINTYRSYLGQLLQIQHEIQNLRQMGVAGVAARALGVENEIRSLKQLRDASQNLYKTLQSGGNYVDGIQRLINVSDMTADQWLSREKKLVQQKNADATYLMKTGEDISRAVEEAQKQREQVLSDYNFNDGIVAIAQKTNVLVGNLATLQQEQLLAMKSDMEVRALEEAQDVSIKNAKEVEARMFIINRIKAQEKQNNALFD